MHSVLGGGFLPNSKRIAFYLLVSGMSQRTLQNVALSEHAHHPNNEIVSTSTYSTFVNFNKHFGHFLMTQSIRSSQ